MNIYVYIFKKYRSSRFAGVKPIFFHPLLEVIDQLVAIGPLKSRQRWFIYWTEITSYELERRSRRHLPVWGTHHAGSDLQTTRSLHFRETCRHGCLWHHFWQWEVLVTRAHGGHLCTEVPKDSYHCHFVWWPYIFFVKRQTNLITFVLHVRRAEDVLNIFSGHGLQELTHLLFSL